MSNTSEKRFLSQWDENRPLLAQVFTEPSLTVPDQSLTIPEIIAKYTRTGLVPATLKLADKGGMSAAEPESDPLDDYTEVQRTVAQIRAEEEAARKAAEKQEPTGDAAEKQEPTGDGEDLP